MDTQPIDTTDILARPREYAAKLETMRAALEAVTAQLAAVTAERDAARDELRILRGIAEDTDGWAALFGTASKDALQVEATIKGARAMHAGVVESRDAAGAEVARITELAIAERDSAAKEIGRLTAVLTFIADILEADNMPATAKQLRAQLRGDTAPARCHVCNGDRRLVTQENISVPCHWCDGSGKEPAPARAEAGE